MSEERPDPDRLLSEFQKEEARKARGRLKIFFGAAAGVGKTYAMLEQARVRRGQGVDVVAGWVETHGRRETQALLEGLEIVPPRNFPYRGTVLREFDLDAALARKPQLLLLDELAHTNAAGARHTKRWQDVEEILAAGIDVYTTLNVQHVESLNDIVAQTTGVTMRETVPDWILDDADEIEVVDLTPDDLLQRLQEGKVYIPAQAERALRGFFSKGNLIALRELALRRTAERVDAQMRSYKTDRGIRGVWPVAERLLVCVSAGPSAIRVVRGAGRMAAGLRAEWIVAHVEDPEHLRKTQSDRERIAVTLQAAEQLGAETATLTGHDVSEEILEFARTRNVTKIVVGKPAGPWWRYRILGSVVERLIRKSNEIDVYVIRGSSDEGEPPPVFAVRRRSPARSYLWAAGVVALTTLLAGLMDPHFSLANVIMVYLSGVVLAAGIWGRGPSILASILSVAAFDFFFVPPRLTFAVRDSEYLVTFGVMLAVALTISTLTVRLRQQAESYRLRQERTAALYRMSREFTRRLTIEEVVQIAERHLGSVFTSEVWILIPDARGRLAHAPGVTSAFPLDVKETEVAQWVHSHGEKAGLGTDTLSGARALYMPLITSRGTVGVLGLFPTDGKRPLRGEQLQLLETFADQTALVIERALLAQEAHEAQVRMESEHLRNLLLSSVSHDLRTPLASITGAASGLLEEDGALDPPARRQLTESILEDTERLNRRIGDLLSMTRIESGAVRVEKEWQPVEEVIGAALNRLEKALSDRPVTTRIPKDLPLVPFDIVLVEQVLVNLLENALKYTPHGAPLELSAWAEEGGVVIEVADRGSGLAERELDRVFEKFYRGRDAQDQGGVGLGLAICRGIVEAHGGRIWAENRTEGGAAFRFLLPIDGSPPMVDRNEQIE